MADENINQSIVDYIEAMSMDTEQTLRSINLTLKQIARQDGLAISQSSLKDMATIEQQAQKNRKSTDSSNKTNPRRRGRSDDEILDDMFDKQHGQKKTKEFFDKLTDDMEDSFTKALFGTSKPFETVMRKSMVGFANSLGTNLDGLGNELGKRMGNILKQGKFTGPLTDRIQKETNWIKNRATSAVEGGLNSLSARLGGAGDIRLSELLGQEDTNKNGNEPPKINDIDNIVNSNVIDLKDSIFNNIDALQNKLAELSQAGVDANDARITEILHSIDALRDLLAETSEQEEGGESAVESVLKGNAENEEALAHKAEGVSDVLDVVSGGAGELGDIATNVAEEAFPMLGAAAIGAGVLLDVASDLFAEDINRVQESLNSWSKSLYNVMFRSTANNAKFMEEQKKRMQADQEALVNTAYKVITESAEKIEQVWDNVLTTVAATQGYSKAGVQELWSNYAARLTNEGLSSVVSSADIMEKLESVLQSGLSGAVAEEFAYQATLLSNAVPTEDFFQYAETYASIAANAIKNGASQEEAIQAANDELTQFANNLLYASREIAGGFTTSLQGASDLFKSATNIAMASRTGDVSNISGVLTSVSAIVGAIAPDLAGTLIDSVVRAATGGNSSEITALRSMAGVGASNTAFLQEFANNPQKIFATLFQNLAELQNMSADNYMEVAEGLSSVFGLSMDAFARVDFAYLADAISAMNVDSEALSQNMELLKEGQTTSTAAQMRMQEINKYMVEEGLAYVLDNEAARLIQQHMWDEQLAREITESLLNVDLKGESLNLINSIVSILGKIKDLVSPSAWAQRFNDLKISIAERGEPNQDVADSLNKYVVGKGNKTALRHLLTTGDDLGLADEAYSRITGATNLFEMLGVPKGELSLSNVSGYNYKMVSKSDYAKAASSTSAIKTLTNKATSFFENVGNIVSDIFKELLDQSKREKEKTAQQQKNADVLSKALSDSLKKYNTTGDSSLISAISTSFTASADTLIKRDAELLEKGVLQHRSFLTDAEIAAKVSEQMISLREGGAIEGTFEHWLEQFQKESGYSDLEAELEKYGQSMDIVEAMYEQQQAANSSAATKARQLHEVQFWEDMQNFATVDFPWYMREWERYYIQHEAYNEATGGSTGKGAYEAAVELRAQEQGEFGDSVFALAKALTENQNWQEELGDKLKEPAVQTNALLAQILLLVDAIRQQNNDTSIVSVPTALSALGLNITNK